MLPGLALAKDTPQTTELAHDIELRLPATDQLRARRMLNEERQVRGITLQQLSEMQAQTP